MFWFEVHSRDQDLLDRFLRLVNDKINPLFITKWIRDVPGNDVRMGYVAIQTNTYHVQVELSELLQTDHIIMSSSFESFHVMRQVHDPRGAHSQFSTTRNRSKLSSRSRGRDLESDKAASTAQKDTGSCPEVDQASNEAEKKPPHGSQDDSKSCPRQQKRPVNDTSGAGETSSKRPRLDTDSSITAEPLASNGKDITDSQKTSQGTLTFSLPQRRLLEIKRDNGIPVESPKKMLKRSLNDENGPSTPPPEDTSDGELAESKDSHQQAELQKNILYCSICKTTGTIWSVDALDWRNVVRKDILVCQGCALAPEKFREVRVLYRGPMVSEAENDSPIPTPHSRY